MSRCNRVSVEGLVRGRRVMQRPAGMPKDSDAELSLTRGGLQPEPERIILQQR